MICTKCGHHNPELSTFCSNCGYHFGPSAPVNKVHAQPTYYAVPTPPETIPYAYKPISAWGYFGWNILFNIPLVGFVLLILFACGISENKNLTNYARSFFCIYVVIFIIFLVFLLMGLNIFATFAGALNL